MRKIFLILRRIVAKRHITVLYGVSRVNAVTLVINFIYLLNRDNDYGWGQGTQRETFRWER